MTIYIVQYVDTLKVIIACWCFFNVYLVVKPFNIPLPDACTRIMLAGSILTRIMIEQVLLTTRSQTISMGIHIIKRKRRHPDLLPRNYQLALPVILWLITTNSSISYDCSRYENVRNEVMPVYTHHKTPYS